MDRNEDKIDNNMQLMMEQLQHEWERSGCPCKRVTVNVKDLECIHMIIVDQIQNNGEWLNKDILSFKHCLKISKENFILLRLARKIKKTEEQIKKETKWICIDLNREEARIYKKMVKENTDFGGRRNEL